MDGLPKTAVLSVFHGVGRAQVHSGAESSPCVSRLSAPNPFLPPLLPCIPLFLPTSGSFAVSPHARQNWSWLQRGWLGLRSPRPTEWMTRGGCDLGDQRLSLPLWPLAFVDGRHAPDFIPTSPPSGPSAPADPGSAL